MSRAQDLVLAYGWNVTAYQILNPGIEHWAPGCPDDALAAAVADFEEFAHARWCSVCYVWQAFRGGTSLGGKNNGRSYRWAMPGGLRSSARRARPGGTGADGKTVCATQVLGGSRRCTHECPRHDVFECVCATKTPAKATRWA